MRASVWLFGISTILLGTACSVAPTPADENRTTIDSNGLSPQDPCEGVDCPTGGGGGGGDDDPDDGGGKGAPYPGEPVDTVQPGKPPFDLLPVKTLQTFCARDKDGALVVNIENAGTMTSPPTTTRVTFAQVGDVSLPTPSIPPGARVQVRAPIPRECFLEGRGNCSFQIMADAWLEVIEGKEWNNLVSDTCPGF